jgi:hypothetical protein
MDGPNVKGRSDIRTHPFCTFIFFSNKSLPGIGEVPASEKDTYSQFLRRLILTQEYECGEYFPQCCVVCHEKGPAERMDEVYAKRTGKKAVRRVPPRVVSRSLFTPRPLQTQDQNIPKKLNLRKL